MEKGTSCIVESMLYTLARPRCPIVVGVSYTKRQIATRAAFSALPIPPFLAVRPINPFLGCHFKVRLQMLIDV